MLTVALGLVGALLYGSADFIGGVASRALRPLVATAIASTAGLVAVGLLLLVLPGSWSVGALLAGLLSGLAGAVAITMLYACLAIGPMSVLSPITAVVSAIVPVAWGIASGESVGSFGVAGLVLAVPAIALVATVPGQRGRLTARGLLLALGAGVGIGLMLVGFDAAPDDAGLTPLVAHRTVGVVLLGLGVLVTLRRGMRVAGAGTTAARRGIAMALGAGVVDAGANACILIGTTTGDLTVMSVLTALYPAGTVLLAAIVLRERILPLQWTGLALALAAAVLLAV